MSKFELTIDLDNDAFRGELDEINNDELAAIVRLISEHLQDIGTHTGISSYVRDYNGNKVGQWSIEED